MPNKEKETTTPKNDGEKTLDEKNLDELSEEELRKAAKSFKGRFEHERKKKEEFKETVESISSDDDESTEDESSESDDEDETTSSSQDPYEFAKELSALQGLSEKQVDAVKTIAKAKDISPSEARETDEAQKLIDSYEEEEEKKKQTPEPSNKQSPPEGKSVSLNDLKEAVKKSDKDSMDDFLEEEGFEEFGEAFK